MTRSRIIASLLLLLPSIAFAQTETFDIVTYQSPAGWKKQTADYAVSFSRIDNLMGTWCQMGIYNSVPNSGNPSTDFSNEWKSLVKPDTYAGAVEPLPRTSIQDGWTYNTGTSKFQWQGKDSHVTLLNISGYGVMVSVHVSGNTDQFNAEVDSFLKSLQMKKPAQQSQSASNQQTTTTTAATNSAPITITSAPGNSGIAISTTNFDDGWVSQPFADYVMVTKQPVTVLLHYAIQIDDEMRRIDNMAAALWDRIITQRYRTSNVRVFQNEQFTYNRIYFMEADAVELSGGKQCYIGLRVLVANGIARPIEIVAPSMAVFQKEFADQAKIEAMTNYNKFAVSPKDIVGVWEESSSSGIDMYSTVTGQYAGMNTSASAHSFEFRADGTYHSTHKGAYGMTGSMKFYDQKYDGKHTLTNWDVTMTNRFEGKTDIFWCQYEAVRGGRVLRLQDKSASGIVYSLVRVR